MMKLILYFSLIYQLTQLTQGFITLGGIQNLILSPPGCLACYRDEAYNYFTSLNRLSPYCADKEIDVFRKIPKMFLLAHICIYQTGTGFQPKYNELQFQGNIVLKKFQNCFKKTPLNPIGRKMLKDATILFEQGRKRCQNGNYLEGGLKGLRKLYPLPTPLLFKIPKKVAKSAYKKPKINIQDKTETSSKHSTGVAKKHKKSNTKILPQSNTLPSENSVTDEESVNLDESNVPFNTNDSEKIYNSEDSFANEAQEGEINSDGISPAISDPEMFENQFTPLITDNASVEQIQNNDMISDITSMPSEDLKLTNDQSEITLGATDIAVKEENLQDSFENQSKPLVNDGIQESPIEESDQFINNDTIEENATADLGLSVNGGVQENPIVDAKYLTKDAVEEDNTSSVEPPLVNDEIQENTFVDTKPLTKATVEEDTTSDTEPLLINDLHKEYPAIEVQPTVNDEAGENQNADTQPLTNDAIENNVISNAEPLENNVRIGPMINDVVDENIAEPNESTTLTSNTLTTVQEDLKTLNDQSELVPTNSFISEAQDDEIDPNFSEDQSEPLVNEVVVNNSSQLLENDTVSQDDTILSPNNTSEDEDQITSSKTESQPPVKGNNALVPLEETFIAAPVGTSEINSLQSHTEGLITSPVDPIVEGLANFQDNIISDSSKSSSSVEEPVAKSEDAIIPQTDDTPSINKILEENSDMLPVDGNASTKIFEPVSEDQLAPLVNDSPEVLTPNNNPQIKDDSITSQIDTFSNNLEKIKHEEITPQVIDSHVKDLNSSQTIDSLIENNSAMLQPEVNSEVDQQGETLISQKKTKRPPFKKVKGKRTVKKKPKQGSSLVEPIPNERIAPQIADSKPNELNQNQKDDPIIEDNSILQSDIKSAEKPILTSNDPSLKASETQFNEDIIVPTKDPIVQDLNQIQKDVSNIGNISTLPSPEIELKNEFAPQNTNNSLPNSEEVKSEEENTQPEIKLEDDPLAQTTNNSVSDNYATGVKPDEEIIPQMINNEAEDLSQIQNNTLINENENTPSSTKNELENEHLLGTLEKQISEKSEENIPQTINSLVKEQDQIQENVPIIKDGLAPKTADASVSQDSIVSDKFEENIIPDSPVEQQNKIPITEDTFIPLLPEVELTPQTTDVFVSQDSTPSDKSEENSIPQAIDLVSEENNQIHVPNVEDSSTTSLSKVEPLIPSDKSEENIIPQTIDSPIEDQNQIQENVPITKDNFMPSPPENGLAPQTTNTSVSQDSTPLDELEENIPQTINSVIEDENQIQENAPILDNNSTPLLEVEPTPQTTDASISQETIIPQTTDFIIKDKNEVHENTSITENNSMPSLPDDGPAPQITDAPVSDNFTTSSTDAGSTPQTTDALVSQDSILSDKSEENIIHKNLIQENTPITENNSMPSSPETKPTPKTTDDSVSQDLTPSDKSVENITPQTIDSSVDQNQIQEQVPILNNAMPSSKDDGSNPETTKLSSDVNSIDKDTPTLEPSDIPTRTPSEVEEKITTPEITSETKLNNTSAKENFLQTSDEITNTDTLPSESSSKVEINQEPQANSSNNSQSKNEKNSLPDDQTSAPTLSSEIQSTTQNDVSPNKQPDPLQIDPILGENPTHVDHTKVDDMVENKSDVNSIPTEQQNDPQNKIGSKPKEIENVTKEYKKMMNDLQLDDTEKVIDYKNETHDDFKKRYEENPYIF